MCTADRSRPPRIDLTQGMAEAVLESWLGGRVTCYGTQVLTGGICSAVHRLDFDRAPYSAVIKLHDDPPDDVLLRERIRLDYLHRHTEVACPRVYAQDDSAAVIPYSFLLIERLRGVNLESVGLAPDQRAHVERELADVLLELHSHKGSVFGELGNQHGDRCWPRVFLPDLRECREDMNDFLSSNDLGILDHALAFAEDTLRDHGEPTLVHNDVWAGNIMVHEGDDGWRLSGLLDPVGLGYAEVEKELAYLEALDTVGTTFFETYTACQPLRPGYEYRRLFYWLHTYMVHLWLGFGREYVDRVTATSRQIVELSR